MITRIAIAAACLALATPALAAKELPACDSSEIEESTLENNPVIAELYELKEWKSSDAKKQRWCYAYYTAWAGMRGIYMEAVFTLEWVDEKSGRYLIQYRQQSRTCRGNTGDPWTDERCK